MQGGNATDTAEAIVKVAAAIKTAYCRSKLLLLGLLPVVEQAKYQAYEYKDVSESGNDYFRKITTINTYLAKFASHVDGVMFANCHDLFLDRSNSNNIDRLLLQDGIHMTRPGQQLLFRCIKDHLSQAQALEKVPLGP